jgi:hypothetical protein
MILCRASHLSSTLHKVKSCRLTTSLGDLIFSPVKLTFSFNTLDDPLAATLQIRLLYFLTLSFKILLSLKLLWRNNFVDASIDVILCMFLFFLLFFVYYVGNVHVVFTIYMLMIHKYNKDQ